MAKSIKILIADDNVGNLQASQKAVDELRGLEAVCVDISTYKSLIVPVGRTLEPSVHEDKKAVDTANALLAKGVFPASAGDIIISSPAVIGGAEYFNRAGEAIRAMQGFDAVVTDFLFKGEDKDLHSKYLWDYVRAIATGKFNSAFGKILNRYYNDDSTKAQIKLGETLEALRTGKVSEIALEELILQYSGKGDDFHRKQREKFEALLRNLPNIEPEFAYGGPIMLEAAKQGKPSVLITSIHRHAGDFSSVATSIAGVIALLPLIEQGVISVEGAINDRDTKYAGSDEGGGHKDSPEGWKVALAKVIRQYTSQVPGAK